MKITQFSSIKSEDKEKLDKLLIQTIDKAKVDDVDTSTRSRLDYIIYFRFKTAVNSLITADKKNFKDDISSVFNNDDFDLQKYVHRVVTKEYKL